MEVESELEGLLATFPELKLHTGKGMVVCSLSHHEMPGRAQVVRAYVDGKKFRTLKAEKDFDFGRLQPYIIPSRKRKRQLFCALTNRYMNRKPAEVELHLKGKRYRHALDDYNAGRLSLFEERFGKKGPAGNTAAVGKEEEEMEGERKEDEEEAEKEEKSEPLPASTMTSKRGGDLPKSLLLPPSFFLWQWFIVEWGEREWSCHGLLVYPPNVASCMQSLTSNITERNTDLSHNPPLMSNSK